MSSAGVGLQDFDVLGALGTGSTAEVLLVRKIGSSNTLHAMKMISKTSLGSTRAVEQVIEENKILQSLRHPFIVGLHYAFQDTSHFFFVLTYAGGGDLLTFLESRGSMVENTARLVTAEVVLALQHLVRPAPPVEPPHEIARRAHPSSHCPPLPHATCTPSGGKREFAPLTARPLRARAHGRADEAPLLPSPLLHQARLRTARHTSATLPRTRHTSHAVPPSSLAPPPPSPHGLATALTHAPTSQHSLSIVYRDLKPENILIAVDGHIVLAGKQ